MLAFFLGDAASDESLGRRVGSSLGLFAGFAVPDWLSGRRRAWQLPIVGKLPPRLRRTAMASQASIKPAVLSDGTCVQVHGWIDNCAELAHELDCTANDPALIVGHAIKAWGDNAESRIVGDYCAVYHDPAGAGLRLSRSPLYGPPLYYARISGGLAAASVPRVLESMGLPRELNPQRIVDSLYFNYADEESYLKGCFKVPLGGIVHLGPDTRRLHIYYNALEVRPQPKASAQDYIREADRLLEEACALYGASARDPGVLLTGGLDSSNVAARVLRHWPANRRLNGFTYVPIEDHGQEEIPGALIDEGPAVKAFAAMHPQIVPHFIGNHDIEFDHRLEEMFAAMGTGTVMAAPLFRYHGIFRAAQLAGNDMVLSADHGNLTFSANGKWGYAEYFRKLRWASLWQALRGERLVPGSLLRKFIVLSIMPSLPDPVWRLTRRMRGLRVESDNRYISALRAEALAEHQVEERAKQAGNRYDRPAYGWRKDVIRDGFQRGDVEGSDMIQGWEQLYEVSMRDPSSYRPLVDFCLGLPTEMFLRNGQTRWLARELGRGEMPEAQRTMPGFGQHAPDWHRRLTPRRADMRQEIEAIRADPILADLIDTEMLLSNVDNWPQAQSLAEDIYFPHAFRLPRAIAMGRFVRYMTGQNQP